MKDDSFPKDRPMPETDRISDLIRKHRVQKGLSQEELALKAGLAPLSVHYIETRQRYPKFDTVARIAKALEVPVAVLVMEASLPA